MERSYSNHDSPQSMLAISTLHTMQLLIHGTRESDPHSVLNVLRKMVGLPKHTEKENDFLLRQH